jgi:hypothetical protein
MHKSWLSAQVGGERVSGKVMIKRNVFLENHHNIFNRSGGFCFRFGSREGVPWRDDDTENEHCQEFPSPLVCDKTPVHQ